MKTARLQDMVKGWFVGGFEPAAFNTESCEVGVKIYQAGEKEAAHYHKVATSTSPAKRLSPGCTSSQVSTSSAGQQ
ncbi:hypothetical protein PSYMO_01929 [Pseudomonas amygdali pv. mori str. 301020]|uniref:Uncharacterized protein n=1 Tax=Pseudomonas amygdali pv. mori str. 301020 TaxID=629261 RepID=A0A656G2U2_PSEA0|nr:hypothetical protein PSYMO_01929 [Pseudomonas amygdali pv. mori str. 301020]